jgi:hypothetical protein
MATINTQVSLSRLETFLVDNVEDYSTALRNWQQIEVQPIQDPATRQPVCNIIFCPSRTTHSVPLEDFKAWITGVTNSPYILNEWAKAVFDHTSNDPTSNEPTVRIMVFLKS